MCSSPSPPPPPPPVYIPAPEPEPPAYDYMSDIAALNQQMQDMNSMFMQMQTQQEAAPPPPPQIIHTTETINRSGSGGTPQTAMDPVGSGRDDSIYGQKRKGRKSLKIRRTAGPGGGSGLNLPGA